MWLPDYNVSLALFAQRGKSVSVSRGMGVWLVSQKERLNPRDRYREPEEVGQYELPNKKIDNTVKKLKGCLFWSFCTYSIRKYSSVLFVLTPLTDHQPTPSSCWPGAFKPVRFFTHDKPWNLHTSQSYICYLTYLACT